ncbi:MAG TPA: chitobiase/beta-hexosaminidase C-terminal domain-containing protein, partial [Verrucomicrobiae bacterium]|nr:chitobiase/beta-hexosaminidase C-terminal domain-containing protein [Verrucomicrobiae bacterium]
SGVPPGLTNAVSLAAGQSHGLALLADGRVVGWGDNTYGKATASPGLVSVIAISAGAWHSLALKGDGRVVAWGQTDYGQTSVPPGLSNVVAIAAGGHHNLALTSSGKVVAWGYNLYEEATVPTNLDSVVAIAAGYSHSLALKSDGTVVSWGSMKQYKVPADLNNVVAIAGGYSQAGYEHSAALKADGTVVSWGYLDQTSIPPWLANVVEITAGNNYTLALRRDGTVVGTYSAPYFAPLTNVVTLAGGESFFLAAIKDGPAANPFVIGPFGMRAYSGGTVFMPVLYKGSKPTSYQWRKAGAALADQTNSVLTITNLQAADAGDYSVVLGGSFGAVTSPTATVRIVARGTPEIQADGETLIGNVTRAAPSTISMSTLFPNGSVFYTTDGSAPTFASTPYREPFVITQTTTLRAIAYSLDFSQSVEDGPWQVTIAPTFELTKTVRGSGAIASSLNSTKYFPQTTVELLAYPGINWRFVRWEGDACGPLSDTTILMDANKTATAVFEPLPLYQLVANTPGGGTVTDASGLHYEGTLWNISAHPASGWQFLRWQGDATGNNPDIVVKMDRPKNVQAIFGTMVTTAVGGSGQVALYPSTGPYLYGSRLRIAARPSAGYYFATWGGDASLRANPLEFLVTKPNLTISALFAPLPANAVNMYVDVDGQGMVALSPDPPSYSPGSSVTLTAIPAPGWQFVQWRGALSGTSSNTTVVLDTSKTATAVFQILPTYTLTATTAGGGAIYGNVGSPYPEGTVVNLTVQSTPGWSFIQWEGDASGPVSSIAVTMDRAKNVQAILGTPVSVNVVGPGSVAVSPSQSSYAYGSTVRLTATPQPGVLFTSWGNDASGSESQLDYLVTKANASICALFSPPHQELPSSLSITLVTEGVRLRFTGNPGSHYDIQRAPAISGPWDTIVQATAPVSGIIEHVDTPLTRMNFYRFSATP